jgi:hypothetical protein
MAVILSLLAMNSAIGVRPALANPTVINGGGI